MIAGKDVQIDCSTLAAKREVFTYLLKYLRNLENEDDLRNFVRDLSARYQVPIPAICEGLCMSWEELATLAADPLVTIGAHTVNHVILGKASERVVRRELEMSQSVIEAALNVRPFHLGQAGDPRLP